MHAMLIRNVRIISVVLLLASLAAYAVSSKLQNIISAPILSLAESARRIGKGHFDHRVEVHSKDELGYLAQSFNNMAEDLQTTTTSIDNLNHEITERKKAEQELRETSQYLENLFNCANAPIIVWDPQFKITRFNHAFEALTGRIAHDVIGKSIKILFPTDEVESSMEFIREALEGKRLETVEINILHLDGAVRTVLWNSATLFELDGKTPVATIAQGQDITERKRMEEALRNSEGRFRAIFDNANDGILLADEATKKFYAGNNKICQMLGYSLEEIKNLGVTDIHPKEDLPYVIGQFEGQARGEIVLAKDIPVKRKDGSILFADVNSSLVTVAGRKYLLGVFRDITEQERRDGSERKRATFKYCIEFYLNRCRNC